MQTYALLAIVFEGLFYIAMLIFAIFSTFTAYHIFTFGIDKKTAMVSLAVYLLGAAPLFLSMAASLSLM